MKNLPTFEEFLNESHVNEASNLLKDLDIKIFDQRLNTVPEVNLQWNQLYKMKEIHADGMGILSPAIKIEDIPEGESTIYAIVLNPFSKNTKVSYELTAKRDGNNLTFEGFKKEVKTNIKDFKNTVEHYDKNPVLVVKTKNSEFTKDWNLFFFIK
jgi:hypothetical protein